jgi:probable phosphoglycerate mutase
MTRRLILARHGQTDANRRGALDSLPPGGPLTEDGRRQARELAAELSDEPIVAIYASRATRAQQTAAPLAQRHGLTVEVVEGVQEVFVGDLEGHTDAEAIRRFHGVFQAWATGELDTRMPGGESAAEVVERFSATLAKLTDRHPGGTVVVVSHGAAIRLVTPFLAGEVPLARASHTAMPNTGRVVLADEPAAPTGWRCVEWTGITLS